MRLVRRLNQEQGKTVIYVTHDPRMADFADRVVNMLDGIIASQEVRNGQGDNHSNDK
jgi:putative ABC transport system ATP-binding protein